MSKRLTPAMRKQIISDYKHGIPNPEYRVIDRGDGTYQVRKRDSKFKLSIDESKIPKSPPPEEKEEEEEKKEPKQESTRMTNEELLRKLSVLLDVPQKEVDKTPEEYDKENEEYQEDQEFIQQTMNLGCNPYYRRRPPLRLY